MKKENNMQNFRMRNLDHLELNRKGYNVMPKEIDKDAMFKMNCIKYMFNQTHRF